LLRVFEQAPVAVAVFRGPNYVIELANPAVCALWGRTPAQALGTPLFELLPEAAGQGFEELLDGVLATGVPYVAHELPSKIDRGSTRVTVHWNFVYKALRDIDGQISRLVVVAADASEQVQARQRILDLNEALATANERLRVSIAELEQKVADRTNALVTTLGQLDKRRQEVTQALAAEQHLGELKSRFVAMASHEFRTPLTVVLSSADLIERYPGPDQQPQRLRHLNHIRAAAKQLVDILEEFLSVSRIEEGNLQTRAAAADVPALLGEVIADVQVVLKPGQTVDWHLQGGVPARLDASLLRKILLNLLSNAIKYSGAGSVVTLRGTCDGQQLTLSVQDQGVGISQEDQAHLFERFFRARNVSTIPGTGLGLYIIGKYLELMGGTIVLQSELNVGTTFTLTVPYEKHPAD
jgi:signal transduction histidine kinase